MEVPPSLLSVGDASPSLVSDRRGGAGSPAAIARIAAHSDSLQRAAIQPRTRPTVSSRGETPRRSRATNEGSPAASRPST